MPTRLGIRVVAVALASAAYLLGCHWLMTQAEPSPWNVVGVLTPMLAVIALGAWRDGQRAWGTLAAVAIAALCAQALAGVALPPQWLYAAQHIGIHLFLAFGFGGTLRAGRTPLISALARRVHGTLSADMAAYTRRCTVAWVVYFVGMAAVSVLLFAIGPFERWALFANLLTPVSLVAMFVGEYWLRYRLHPEFERASLADAIRSYQLEGAKPEASPAHEANPATGKSAAVK